MKAVSQTQAAKWLRTWDSLVKAEGELYGGEMGINDKGQLFIELTYRVPVIVGYSPLNSIEGYTFDTEEDPIDDEMRLALLVVGRTLPEGSPIKQKIAELLHPILLV